ncbi:MAG: tRNA nucleotidyltransferase [Rhodothermaceae bacterium]|nr:MAG: tRNA nucleotidyltransferase [Rhodothermaceae bacterium]
MNLSRRLKKYPYEPLLRQVGEVAQRQGVAVYAVGGVVRDVMLGRPTTDIDFVTVGPGTGIRLAEAVAAALGGQTAHVYPSFGTAALRLAGFLPGDQALVLEFVAARRESYRANSRKPLVEDGTLEDDLRRRDFTVNALAIHLAPDRFGELIDLDGSGVRDLERRILRTPLDPLQTFEDDPLRMIRAARFAAQLGFTIHPETFAAMQRKAHRVRILSQERITDELQKIMTSPRPSTGWRLLFEAGLLEPLFPELAALKGVETIEGYRHKDNFDHTLQVLDNLIRLTRGRSGEATLWLRWATLLHDIGKPKTKRFKEGIGWTFHGHEDVGARMIPKIFRRLRLPSDERMRYVQKLVRLHHRPVALVDENVTDSAVRRLLFDAGDDIDDLMTLVRADITSKNPRRVRRYLRAFDEVEKKMAEVEEKDRLRNFQPPVDGHEIMQTLGLKPGPVVGRLKEAVREAILEGVIPNEHDAAFDYLMRIKDEILADA